MTTAQVIGVIIAWVLATLIEYSNAVQSWNSPTHKRTMLMGSAIFWGTVIISACLIIFGGDF